MSPTAFDTSVVSLMQGDVARLGDDPAHALRLVLRLSGGLETLHARLRRELDLHASEYAALVALWDGGRCSLSQLSTKVELSRAAMTQLVDRLEVLGLVERVPSPTDRRVVLLALHPVFETRLLAAAAGFGAELTRIAARDPATWSVFADTVDVVRSAALDAADVGRTSRDYDAASSRTARGVRRFARAEAMPPSW